MACRGASQCFKRSLLKLLVLRLGFLQGGDVWVGVFPEVGILTAVRKQLKMVGALAEFEMPTLNEMMALLGQADAQYAMVA